MTATLKPMNNPDKSNIMKAFEKGKKEMEGESTTQEDIEEDVNAENDNNNSGDNDSPFDI